MAKEKQELESALQRLEQIIQELGKNDVDVETGLEKFREGVDLIKLSRAQLKKAENEFKELKEQLESFEEKEE